MNDRKNKDNSASNVKQLTWEMLDTMHATPSPLSSEEQSEPSQCGDRHEPSGYVCTGDAGHAGGHVALGASGHVHKVWPIVAGKKGELDE